jgi:hypothetical protein
MQYIYMELCKDFPPLGLQPGPVAHEIISLFAASKNAVTRIQK